MTYIFLRSHDLLGYNSPARDILTPATAVSRSLLATPPVLAPQPPKLEHSGRLLRWELITRV